MKTGSDISVAALLVEFLLLVSARDIPHPPDHSDCALSHEIAVSDLPALLGSESGRDSLKAEFHKVLEGARKPWNVASLLKNRKKNRYENLYAYDETRVILNKLPGDPNSDYINANYINGVNREREYVATQGPLPNTVDDFWRMIWQLNATKIVALANVREHGKVKMEKYWPDKSRIYGDFEITLLSEHAVEDHKLRTLRMKQVNGPQSRIVKQFHFTGWPDFGVPESRLSFAALLRQARKHNADEKAPLVVHCSAGVGRTGTAILTDSMLQKAHRDHVVDFQKRLEDMRNQRVDVVEKEGQYLFAFDVVNDAFAHNEETDHYMKEIDETYQQFQQIDDNNNVLA